MSTENKLLDEFRKEIADLLYALKDTHNFYVEALKNGNHFTHDMTRLMSNEHIFQKYELLKVNNKLTINKQ